MISVDEALNYILSHIEPLPAEKVELLEGLDRILAEDIVADINIPPFPNSAMDGYAVRASDTAGASPNAPVELRVIEEVAAGAVPQAEIIPGTAARIMTGAPMPRGADAVVRFEDTSEGREALHNSIVRIYKAASPMQNVRPAGEDIRRGQRVLEAGRLLRPQELGVLAALGRPTVRVHRRPRVALLATGDELVDIDEEIAPGKIRNINEYTTAAQVRRYGGVPVQLGIARDTVEDLTRKIRAGLEQDVDLFLTSAGVSIGDYDVVKNVLAAEGEMHFWQVAIKPGKPLAFGQIAGVPVLGLPGNPVAAMVAFEVFARPAIRKMSGWTRWEKPRIRATLREDVTNSGRRHYMRAVVFRSEAGYEVTTRGDTVAVQGSGILTSMVWANAFLVVPEGETFLPAGSQVEVEMLDWPETVF
ncbi:MAG: molybdopterin molybdenumtransferase MoeA [Chloroflexi bacterium]|nr:MAG: molybdopterin molybdenumtransferase MoeA [Chloroflexota bacterium]